MLTQTTHPTQLTSLATLVIRSKFERMLRTLDTRYTAQDQAWFRKAVR